jgi:deoxycytidine triphosphate deaminase
LIGAVLSGSTDRRGRLGVLGRAEVERLLSEGAAGREKVFVRGTWDRNQFRLAAYDLRIACDYLITPKGKRYWPAGKEGNQRLERPFRIEPGEVAFVSSVEELRMPDDLAANIAVQFRSALKGILVMGGLLVDPGYHGRLHFQLANLGDEDFTIVPGETSVAAVQFLPVIGKVAIEEKAPDSDALLKGLFYDDAEDPLPPLAFFSSTVTAKDEIATVREIAERQDSEVRATKLSTDQLVVFGVFLISASLLAGAVAALVDALAANSYEKAGKVLVAPNDFGLTAVVAAAAVLVAIAYAFYLISKPVRKILGEHERKEGRKDKKEGRKDKVAQKDQEEKDA